MTHATMVNIAALFVMMSLSAYTLVISFQGASLLASALSRQKGKERVGSAPLFESLGIALATYGYLGRISPLICVGALLIALRLTHSFKRWDCLPRYLDVPLLALALLALLLLVVAAPF
jgi:hypothetical protein